MGAFSRRRAIRLALQRLGMQAQPAAVVAFLAETDVKVSAALVCEVKRQLLQAAAKSERQRRPPAPSVRPQRPPPKMPPPRGRR